MEVLVGPRPQGVVETRYRGELDLGNVSEPLSHAVRRALAADDALSPGRRHVIVTRCE
jgi:hypothetical protein